MESSTRYMTSRSGIRTTQPLNSFDKFGRIFLQLALLAIGFLFVFSGFVKAIDPLGSTYKIQDYLASFGPGFHKLSFLAFPLAIALSTFEMVLGFCFLFKIKLKLTSILALGLMLFMLPLTLYIALKNPVTDCGCFGDALVISNWATFWKNVVLFVLILLILIYNRLLKDLFLKKVEVYVIAAIILLGVGLSVYSYRHLPMFDFLPFKVGVNIPQAMKVPEGKPTDKYDTKFIYEKDGVKKEFTLANYPKNDSTWKFVDQKTVLISKGFQPPIHNFEILDSKIGNVTDDVLHYQGTTNLIVAYDLNKSSIKGLREAERIYNNLKNSEIKFYALTASLDEDIAKVSKEAGITFPFYKVDPTTLKSMIRANPGLIIIKNGTITGKWNWRDFE